jgi:hypothetical protein
VDSRRGCRSQHSTPLPPFSTQSLKTRGEYIPDSCIQFPRSQPRSKTTASPRARPQSGPGLLSKPKILQTSSTLGDKGMSNNNGKTLTPSHICQRLICRGLNPTISRKVVRAAERTRLCLLCMQACTTGVNEKGNDR